MIDNEREFEKEIPKIGTTIREKDVKGDIKSSDSPKKIFGEIYRIGTDLEKMCYKGYKNRDNP